MSENLPKLAVETFSTVLRLKLQQTRSMLRGRVMEGYHVGKQASPIDYIGAIQMRALEVARGVHSHAFEVLHFIAGESGRRPIARHELFPFPVAQGRQHGAIRHRVPLRLLRRK